MTKRPTRSRAYAPDPAAPGRGCDLPGCPDAGEYRAPKSRGSLNDYWWFCLEHVREYNAAWDFYRGMTAEQIEAQTRSDTGWQRPTWPLGSLGGRIDEALLRDPLHVLNAGMRGAAAKPRDEAPAELREPLATLGLGWPLTIDVLKQRYKSLAKLHHPDANGGDRSAEERLKTINLAYAALRGRVAAEPRMAATG